MTLVTSSQKSSDSMKQFYQKLLRSPELQAQLKTANDPESLCRKTVELGAEIGYDFTIEQARAAMAIEVAIGGDVLEESNLSDGSSVVAVACCYSRSCRIDK
jgi:hypothetical protein